MVSYWIIAIAWGLGAVIWAEFVRDSYHVLSHVWQPLYRWHVWHHRVFRPDLTPVSDRIYRQANWFHDLPESLVMLLFSVLVWGLAYIWMPERHWSVLAGAVYSFSFLGGAIARATGFPGAEELTDNTHRSGPFLMPPAHLFVNRPYHWRHHFDNQNAYFCGVFTWLDRLMGTALSLKGKTIAVTGASGTLGRSLLFHLHQAGAKVIALTSGDRPVSLTGDGNDISINTVTWQIGREEDLADLLKTVDILILNHGINVHGERTKEAIYQSYEVNAFSSWRLLELFLARVCTNQDIARKEVWVNTSEAEACPAFSPLYELTKRTLGDLVTLRRLDAPCVVRKLILGPFKSNLNPIGVMSGDWVAKQIVKSAKADVRNIIVTINPLTFVAFPIKEFFVSLYFKLFSRRVANLGVSATEIGETGVETTSR